MRLLGDLGPAKRALANRNYRFYILGTVSSDMGLWIYRIALGWLAWELTHSSTWLGIVVIANFTPLVVVSPFAGTIVDRMNYLRMFMISQCISSLLPVTIGILTWSGHMSIELLVFLVVLRGTAYSFVRPSRLALVYNLVGRDDLSAAVSINAIVFNASRFVGPAIGGAVIVSVGIVGCFVATVLTESFLMACLLMLRPPAQETYERKSKGILGDTWDGLRYTFTHAGIAPLLIILVVSSILARPFIDLLPAFADRVFGRGADGLAILMSANGLGATVAGFWMAARGGLTGLTRVVIVNIALFSISLIVFSAIDDIVLAAGVLIITGFTMVVQGVATQVLIQAGTEGAYRGRVLGVYGQVSRGGPAVGAIVLGSLGDVFGMQGPLAVGSTLCLLLWAWARLRQTRMTEVLERDPEVKIPASAGGG